MRAAVNAPGESEMVTPRAREVWRVWREWCYWWNRRTMTMALSLGVCCRDKKKGERIAWAGVMMVAITETSAIYFAV